MSIGLVFDKNTLKRVYDEEIAHFHIAPSATNRLKTFINDERIFGGSQITQQQLVSVVHQMNMFTTADIVTYCLQIYYDQAVEAAGGVGYSQDELEESLYSSGIERTCAYFNGTECSPTYSDETKKYYIETVLFRCFSNYMITKGYRAVDVYRFFIRFACIFNPRNSIVVQLFNNLSNGSFYLRSGNLDEGSQFGFTDRNEFTGIGKNFDFTSIMYSQITSRSFYNVGGQPFMLTIGYGNLDRLDARPYAHVLPTLFYMRDNRVNEFQATKMRIIQKLAQQKEHEARVWKARSMFHKGGNKKKYYSKKRTAYKHKSRRKIKSHRKNKL